MAHTPLSLDEKRRAVYASLMRFAPEALPLRDRALRQLLLGALLGSSAVDAYRIARIREHLGFGPVTGGIRTEVLQSALAQLISDGLVGHTFIRERHAYYLTEEGDQAIATAVVTAEQLISQVLEPLLRDTEPFLPRELASTAFKRFVFECFARFGRTIAKQVTGTITPQELVRSVDARAVCEAALAEHSLSAEQRDSLEARFIAFLRSSAPPDERLKFFLTQGYYFAQLLGIENAEFNPIAEEAFSNAVLYLDTNVIFAGVLSEDQAVSDFIEILEIARRVGIEVRVSQATINELTRVASDRISQLERIVSVVPTELASKTNDQILAAFLNKKAEDPALTPTSFFAPIFDLKQTIFANWPLTVDERTEREMIGDRDSSEVTSAMDEEALHSRGWGKSPKVAEHDAAHFFAIEDLRKEGRKAWLLTRDNSFAAVATRLQPGDAPFYMSHLGFLQSISPFVVSIDEERSFADVFSAFLSDQVRPIETLFDMRELSLMAELHEDVMSTPPEQLVMAFDFVKNRTLGGKPYRSQDMPRVSLELRKFLSAGKDEQLRTLQHERQRSSDEARREQELRRIAEQDRDAEAARRGELEVQLGRLREELSLVQTQLSQDRSTLAHHLIAERRKAVKHRRLRWGALAGVGFVCGPLLWRFGPAVLASTIAPRVVAPVYLAAQLALAAVAATVFVVPSVAFIRNMPWSRELKVALITVVITAALGLGNFLAPTATSIWADRIGVATLLALSLGGLVAGSRTDAEGDERK